MRTRESALAAVASALTEPGVRRTEVRAGEKRLQVPSGRHRAILGKLGICNKKNGHLLMSVLVETRGLEPLTYALRTHRSTT